MTDTSAPVKIYGQGRKPPHPPGHPLRLALPWLHELDPEVATTTPISYPVDCTNGKTSFPMWGNGPDPTLTITDAEGAPGPQGGQPVGNCDYAGKANLAEIDGNPDNLTSNIVVGTYDVYEADSQGVPLGQEQDEGVVMSDSMVWCLTHKWDGTPCALGEGIVTAFIPVERATAPATMQKYGKPLLMGVNLTNADQTTFPKWSASPSNPPNPQEGHVVVLARLISAPTKPGNVFGPANPVSWTQLVDADEPWMNECPEEWWLPVTPADRDKMGAAAYDSLVEQMATLPGFQGQPVVDPTPPPVVVPPVVVTPPPTPDNPNPAPIHHEDLWQQFLEWLRSKGFTVTAPPAAKDAQ